MPTRKFGHFRFLSERAKKPMVERRKAALFKKAKELSILCDVEVAIIIYSPREINSITWPSLDVAATRFIRFLNVPEGDKLKKMVLHENYLQDRVDAETEKVRTKERDLERNEINVLMNQVINGRSLKELDANQLKGLYVLAGEKMQELEKRKKDLLQVQNDVVELRRHETQLSAPLFGSRILGHLWTGRFVPRPLICTSLFVPTMASPQLVDCGGGGGVGSYHHMFLSDAESTNNYGDKTTHVATTSSSSNYDKNQLPCLNQVWPSNFFPPSS